jgi:hypothetical protein
MPDTEEIRPIYSELQGYLSQAPAATEKWLCLYDCSIWEQVNDTIDELSSIAKTDYERFKMALAHGERSLPLATCRAKLGGLISRLHGEYFSDEPAPFSGMPSTVITQTQQQSQTLHIQMLLDLQSKIDEKLRDLEPGDKKRSFLEKVKAALGSVRDYANLLALFLRTAQEVGLTLEEFSALFK